MLFCGLLWLFLCVFVLLVCFFVFFFTMTTIRIYKRKKDFVYQAIVRVKGFKNIQGSFKRKVDAKVWAAQNNW